MKSPIQDNEVLRYYEAEMRYLREAGKEFARAYPDRARMLDSDRLGERDPHVERLFEGFAFLMGRLRQKLDDELPELTEGLVSLLWPHYLRMIPSLSILEMTPAQGALQRHERLPAGLEVMSGPLGEEHAARIYRTIYRTSQPVDLYPLRLSAADVYLREDSRSVIRMRFAWQPQADRMSLAAARLRLYLHADRPVALALYAALTAIPVAIQVREPGYPADRPGAPQTMPDLRFAPAGFGPHERLWPKADNTFGGYQLLLEYFTFPEKFMFIDLVGLDAQALSPVVPHFDVEVVLVKPYPDDLRFSADNLRLFCTPIINLFKLEAEPVAVTQFESEYRVQAQQQGTHIEVYSVDTVQGFEMQTMQRFEYAPFAAFRYSQGRLPHEMPQRYFHTRVRRSPSGRVDTWLVLGGHEWRQQDTLQDGLPQETLSLSVTGTHGALPRSESSMFNSPHTSLPEVSITQMREGFTHIAAVRNLTAPTLPVYPPTSDRFQWRVLSHLAPNYLSLLDAEMLRGSLALYDWTHRELNQRRIEAITDVRHRPVHKMVKGGLERGVEISVTLNSQPFAGEGDLQLFGGILDRFFALYATVNLYTRLVVIPQPSGKRIEWPDTKFNGAPF